MIKILVSDLLSEEGLKILKDVKEFQVDVKTDLKPDALKEIIKDITTFHKFILTNLKTVN